MSETQREYLPVENSTKYSQVYLQTSDDQIKEPRADYQETWRSADTQINKPELFKKNKSLEATYTMKANEQLINRKAYDN